MNSDKQDFAGDHHTEIAILTSTISRSIDRLRVLTTGELNTVTDRQLRSSALQLAQEQFNINEATKQAAILNALPAHIALLDCDGIIIQVNDAWRRFAIANMLPGSGIGIGLDYLATCESARGPGAAEALQVAQGIRAVMDGTVDSFSLEYACHSPTQQRWFQMNVAPLDAAHRGGTVVMHLDISNRRLAEYALEAFRQKTEQRERILSTTLTCITDFAYIYNPEGRIQFANQPLLDLWGRTLDEVVGKNFFDLGYPHDMATRLHADVQRVFTSKKSLTGELAYTSPSGVYGYYEYIFSPVVKGDGSVELVVGSSRNVVAHKRAEEALQASLHEKEALLKEVHHRVKNNLQVIASLLRLEARRSTHDETKAVLRNMKGRIRSMALLHESLYRSGIFATVDLGAYLHQLTSETFRALADDSGLIALHLELDSVTVGMDQASTCGLLVNELLHNCWKHGFPHGHSGEIRVELQAIDAGSSLRLRVSDSGVGLPADFDAKRGDTLGMQLVSDLAGQIGGKLEIGPPPAAVFVVLFAVDQSKLLKYHK